MTTADSLFYSFLRVFSNENMSLDRSTESLNSPSKDNFVPFASYKWSRSNTVRKVNSTPTYTREEVLKRTSVDDIEVSARRVLDNLNVEHGANSEKLRKYLSENTYRQSLESISEYKTKKTFVRPPSSSFESLSSDCTDYVLKTATLADANNKSTILSESSSYLSWIESLNSENFTAETATFATDAKAGEWNNFWLNYNNARNLLLQQQNSCSCNSISENNTGVDEFLDASSTQKESSVEHPGDLFYMTRADMMETIKCCQKIIEILQMAMNKTADGTIRSADSEYVGHRQQNRVRKINC